MQGTIFDYVVSPRFWKLICEKNCSLRKAIFDSSSAIIILVYFFSKVALPIEMLSNFYVNKLTSEIEKANQFLYVFWLLKQKDVNCIDRKLLE